MAVAEQKLRTANGLRLVVVERSPEARLGDITADLAALDLIARWGTATAYTYGGVPPASLREMGPRVTRVGYRNPLEVVVVLAPILVALPSIMRTIRDWRPDKRRASAVAAIAEEDAHLYREFVSRVVERLREDGVPNEAFQEITRTLATPFPDTIVRKKDMVRAIGRLQDRVIEVEPVDTD